MCVVLASVGSCVFVCFVCNLLCGVLWLVVFCVFVGMCACFGLNACVCFVCDVLCDVVWLLFCAWLLVFVRVWFVFLCVSFVIYCVMVCGLCVVCFVLCLCVGSQTNLFGGVYL